MAANIEEKMKSMKNRTEVENMTNFEIINTFSHYNLFLDYNILHRDKDIERLKTIVNRKDKNCVLLIAEHGCGAKSIIEKFASEVYKEQHKRTVNIDVDKLLHLDIQKAELIPRVNKIFNALKNEDNGGYVLTSYDICKLLNYAFYANAGYEIYNGMINSKLPIILSITPKDLTKLEREHSWVIDKFEVVKINPLNIVETTDVLNENIKKKLSKDYNIVNIYEGFTKKIVESADKYIKNVAFPGKAVYLANIVASAISRKNFLTKEEVTLCDNFKDSYLQNFNNKHKSDIKKICDECTEIDYLLQTLHKSGEKKKITIDEEDTNNIICETFDLPVYKKSDELAAELKEFDIKLKEKIKGQDDAIDLVANAIKRSKLGLKKTTRTIGNFLFIGPTGVGKTETAKQVANTLYGSEENILRLDMSEYQSDIDVSKLIGSPPGYVGFKESGVLTNGITKHPNSIILFDEIEKSSGTIYNVLLQLLDEGFITSGDGIKVDARQCMIIMTSNIGVKEARNSSNPVGFSNVSAEERRITMEKSIMEKSLYKRFSPEFLNRIDSICYFKDLNEKTLNDILLLEIEKSNISIKEQFGKTVVLSKAAKKHIVNRVLLEKNGARPIIRIIEQEIEAPIINTYIDGKLGNKKKINVDCKDNKLFINKVNEEQNDKLLSESDKKL